MLSDLNNTDSVNLDVPRVTNGDIYKAIHKICEKTFSAISKINAILKDFFDKFYQFKIEVKLYIHGFLSIKQILKLHIFLYLHIILYFITHKYLEGLLASYAYRRLVIYKTSSAYWRFGFIRIMNFKNQITNFGS